MSGEFSLALRWILVLGDLELTPKLRLVSNLTVIKLKISNFIKLITIVNC